MLRTGFSFRPLYTKPPEKASYFSNSFTNLSANYEEGVNNMRERGVLSAFQLKLLALVTMTIDHTAAVLGAQTVGEWYRPMRNLGRLAFPIYCFLLVEGFFHTRDAKKYMGRLGLVFCLSEVPFDLALYRRIPGPRSNVMLTLLLGLCTVLVLDRGRELLEQRDASPAAETVYCWAVISAGMGLAFYWQTDYRGGGVLLIVLFYLFRGQLWALLTTVPPVLLIFFTATELWGALALLPIALYRGEPGPRPGGKAGQWFFYLYYPLHLTVLAIIRMTVFHVPVELFGTVY